MRGSSGRAMPCGRPLVGHRDPAAGEKFLAAISRDGPSARLQGARPAEGQL